MLNFITKYKSIVKALVIITCSAIIYLNIKNENLISEKLVDLEYQSFILCFIIGLIIMTLWSILIFNTLKGTVDLKIKYKTWAKIFFNSQFYNLIPFGGFFYKGVQLKKYEISYKNYLFNYFFIIWSFAIFAFLIYALEVAFFLDYNLEFFIIPIVILFPALAIIFYSGPFIAIYLIKKLNIKTQVFNFIFDLSNFLTSNFKKKKVRSNFFLNLFVIHIFDFILYYSVVHFLDIPISIKTIFLIWLINTIIDIFPITPQNIAVSELLAAFTGTFIGITFTAGILVRAVVRIVWLCSAVFFFILSNLFLRFEKINNFIRTYQMCSKCVMDTTDQNINFNYYGVCDYCENFDKNISKFFTKKNYESGEILKIVNKIKLAKKKDQKYDCLIGISGGLDSCYLAHVVKNELGLNPLVLHVDTGWNSQEAVNNIEKIIDKLGLDLHTEVINWREMKDLQLAFFKAQLPNLDVPQDHAIFGSMYNYAIKNDIKYILTGGNFSTECIREPLEWAYHASDLKHLKDIHSRFGNIELKSFPFSDIFKYKIYYRFFKGLKVVQPLNYLNYNKSKSMQILEKEYGWLKYSHKHYESRFTKFFEGYWLKKKFGYDKRRAHLSSLILTKQIDREDAIIKLNTEPYDDKTIYNEIDYVCKKLEISTEELNILMEGENKNFRDYKSSHNLIQFFVKISRILKIENRLIR